MGAQITTIIDLWVRASLCYLWIPCWMLSCWKHLAESCYQYPHSTSALSESTSWVLTRTRTWLYVAGKRTAHDTGGMDTKLICLRCKSKGVKPILTSALHQLCTVQKPFGSCYLPQLPLCAGSSNLGVVEGQEEQAEDSFQRCSIFMQWNWFWNYTGSCCADYNPRKYCKDGTVLIQERYRTAFNARDDGIYSEN